MKALAFIAFTFLFMIIGYTCSSATRTNTVNDVYWRFYNGTSIQDYYEFPFNESSNLFKDEAFNKSNPTVLYFHGYNEDPMRESVKVLVSAYLEARPNTNFVLVDWSNMANGSYFFNAAPNVEKVGNAIASHVNSLIEQGLSLETLHVMGHSLGCQVTGYLARKMKNEYKKTIKRVTSLDAVLIGFVPGVNNLIHISADDAVFVDMIHTDKVLFSASFRTGTVDFWPNGGRLQPGCANTLNILCNHWRSWRYFAESVRNPKAFPASPADSYEQFKNNPSPEVGLIYMGYDTDTSATGSYYLTTNAESPFGRGIDGVHTKSQPKEMTN